MVVQDFDYHNYDASRFLSPDAYNTEEEAEAALIRLKADVAAQAPASKLMDTRARTRNGQNVNQHVTQHAALAAVRR